ncbi:MAG: IS607 family transposase [Formivibrio sp.]|nr:IS607 family transposase [Formivibrio sp.]
MDGNDRFLPSAAIRRQFGICNNTLRKYADNGTIRSLRLGGADGKRLYNVDDLAKIFHGASKVIERGIRSRSKVCYARVSSRKQEADLVRQIQTLKERCPNHELIKDVASGINWKRPGLLTLLDRALRGGIEELVVLHRDRLCRFAFELVEHILRESGCKVVVLDGLDSSAESDERELADDLMAITTVFVASHNGRRSAAHRKARKEAQSRAEPTKEETADEEPEMEHQANCGTEGVAAAVV